MGFWNRKPKFERPMTAVEALNNELRRLDSQMSEFAFSDGLGFNRHFHDSMLAAYGKLAEQRADIAKALTEIAKEEVKRPANTFEASQKAMGLSDNAC